MSSPAKPLPPFDPAPSARVTQTPDPGWSWGKGLRDEAANGKEWKEAAAQGWKTWETDSADKR